MCLCLLLFIYALHFTHRNSLVFGAINCGGGFFDAGSVNSFNSATAITVTGYKPVDCILCVCDKLVKDRGVFSF